ncbi:hypothetical protein SAMN05660420_03402 [Desulfuromusa kysingii]|uniref:Lipoprotein n=1 Tax=Desulfuromusa kysingii TaxID=37625 RepID=A0A1H4EJ48_9BACT|nr:hypothetical protein [Desulfuromusa kysingii]SEA84917.1 hypothetical protein SAMN05660420_03402 [Desulfuromusa kysingii]
MIEKILIRAFIVILLPITILACAPVQPPYVENSKYFNPTNNFSIDLPNNWEVSKKIPNWLENSVCVGTPKNLQAYFENKDIKATIQLDIVKTFLNLKGASDNYYSSTFSRTLIDSFYDGLEKSLDKQEKILNSDRFIEDFTYILNKNNLASLPSKIIEVKLKCNDKEEMIKKELTSYIVLCDKDDTCFVNFSLIAPVSDFEKSKNSFNKMIRSLSAWNLQNSY